MPPNKLKVQNLNYLAVSIICILSTLPGCRSLYEGFKAVRTEECYRLPYPDQEECLRQAGVGYDEYEKDREGARRRS
ncbi:MAG TPA: hypothetical protein DDY32_06120 [Desulfobulbaceae bacterium]|nr:hypothetical protein [Desulfobulbaceae bacterium]